MTQRRPSPLKSECDSRGIRYTWLADKLGISPSHLAHIEAGDRPAPDGYYERAAEILGVPVEMIRPEPEAAAV